MSALPLLALLLAAGEPQQPQPAVPRRRRGRRPPSAPRRRAVAPVARRVEGKVTFATATTVYLDAGALEGLAIGQVIQLTRAAQPVGACTVRETGRPLVHLHGAGGPRRGSLLGRHDRARRARGGQDGPHPHRGGAGQPQRHRDRDPGGAGRVEGAAPRRGPRPAPQHPGRPGLRGLARQPVGPGGLAAGPARRPGERTRRLRRVQVLRRRAPHAVDPAGRDLRAGLLDPAAGLRPGALPARSEEELERRLRTGHALVRPRLDRLRRRPGRPAVRPDRGRHLRGRGPGSRTPPSRPSTGTPGASTSTSRPPWARRCSPAARARAVVQNPAVLRHYEGELLLNYWAGGVFSASGNLRMGFGDVHAPSYIDSARLALSVRPVPIFWISGGFSYWGLLMPNDEPIATYPGPSRRADGSIGRRRDPLAAHRRAGRLGGRPDVRPVPHLRGARGDLHEGAGRPLLRLPEGPGMGRGAERLGADRLGPRAGGAAHRQGLLVPDHRDRRRGVELRAGERRRPHAERDGRAEPLALAPGDGDGAGRRSTTSRRRCHSGRRRTSSSSVPTDRARGGVQRGWRRAPGGGPWWARSPSFREAGCRRRVGVPLRGAGPRGRWFTSGEWRRVTPGPSNAGSRRPLRRRRYEATPAPAGDARAEGDANSAASWGDPGAHPRTASRERGVRAAGNAFAWPSWALRQPATE